MIFSFFTWRLYIFIHNRSKPCPSHRRLFCFPDRGFSRRAELSGPRTCGCLPHVLVSSHAVSLCRKLSLNLWRILMLLLPLLSCTPPQPRQVVFSASPLGWSWKQKSDHVTSPSKTSKGFYCLCKNPNMFRDTQGSCPFLWPHLLKHFPKLFSSKWNFSALSPQILPTKSIDLFAWNNCYTP